MTECDLRVTRSFSHTKSTLALGASISLMMGHALAAETEHAPGANLDISIEIQNDRVIQSDDSLNEVNDLYLTIEPYLQLNLTNSLALHGGWVLEPIADPEPGEDRAFEDHGLYTEQVFAQYTRAREGRSAQLFAGKFNPAFGIGWDLTPGLYGTDFAEDYEITERIGFGGRAVFEDERMGAVSITASTFFADTTFLSDSAINRRGQLRKSDGGVSNTEDFSSFSIAVDGEDMARLPGWQYHAAFLHQAAGVGDPNDENGVAIGLSKSAELSGNRTVQVVGEIAFFDNLGGSTDDALYVTLGGAFESGKWTLSGSYTARRLSVAGGADIDDDLVQISAGYAVRDGVGVEMGYRFTEVEQVEDHTVGVRLAIERSYSTRR